MGRSPCCSKEGLNRGAWTAWEDKILTSYIKAHGEGKWRNLPKRAGLKRCGKSCRLRWLNYLRPDIKRGNISPDEEELIIRLHNLLGNRWSLIAGRLPGRTDNEIKNYWNTTLGKKTKKSPSSSQQQQNSGGDNDAVDPAASSMTHTQVIRTKATRAPKNILVPFSDQPILTINDTNNSNKALDHYFNYPNLEDSPDDQEEPVGDDQLLNFDCDNIEFGGEEEDEEELAQNESFYFDQAMLDDWTRGNFSLELDHNNNNENLDLESLSFLLDPDQWT